MNRKRRAGILATMGLAAVLMGSAPAYAGSPKEDSTPIRRIIPDSIEAAWDCFWGEVCEGNAQPCKQEAPCPTHAKQKTRGKRTSTTTRTTQRQRGPSDNPDRIYNHRDPIGNFCESKDGLYDQVKFFKPQLGPWQRTHNYDLRYETPAFFDDFTVTGDEVRTRGQRFTTDDGRTQYVLPLEYKEILSHNGKDVHTDVHKYDFVAYDCPGAPAIPAPQQPAPAPAAPETPAPEAPSAPEVPKTSFKDWTSRNEWTVGIGPYSDSDEVTFLTTGKNPHLATAEDAFAGMKTHVQFEHATDNNLFVIQGATARGTDSPTSGYWNGCERYVQGSSIGAYADLGFGHGFIKPTITGGVEAKRIEQGTTAGPYGDFVEMRYDTLVPHVGAKLVFGDQNYNNFKLGGEYVWQEMNIQRPGLPTTNDGHADGVTEKMLMYTVSGQRFLADDHVRIYADGKYMQPQAQRATNPDEVILDSTAYNARFGVDYYPHTDGGFKIGVEGQFAGEDAKFQNSTTLNRTSAAGLINFGYTWGK